MYYLNGLEKLNLLSWNALSVVFFALDVLQLEELLAFSVFELLPPGSELFQSFLLFDISLLVFWKVSCSKHSESAISFFPRAVGIFTEASDDVLEELTTR